MASPWAGLSSSAAAGAKLACLYRPSILEREASAVNPGVVFLNPIHLFWWDELTRIQMNQISPELVDPNLE